MPIYDYECSACGPFREMRPMSMAGEDCACPVCTTPSPRSLGAMPFLATMEAGRRQAFSTNERASNEPMSSKSDRAKRLHGVNCGCCKPGTKSSAVFRADGSKTFPSRRPWMISH